MTPDPRLQLLFGPYKPPKVRCGNRVWCLYRDRLAVVCGWSDAPLPWPLCRAVLQPCGSAGPLVDEELVRAIRNESVLALCHWWGVSPSTAQRWRYAFAVGRMDAEGSCRLILDHMQTLFEARQGGEEASVRGVWQPEEIALLGVLPDREVVARTGRSLQSVLRKRRLLGRARPEGRQSHVWWTPEHDELALTLPPREVARRTGHTVQSVYQRRVQLRRALKQTRG